MNIRQQLSPKLSSSQAGSRSHFGFCSRNVMCAIRSGSGWDRMIGVKAVCRRVVKTPVSKGADSGDCRPLSRGGSRVR